MHAGRHVCMYESIKCSSSRPDTYVQLLTMSQSPVAHAVPRHVNNLPRGSKCGSSRALGTNNHSEYGIWDLNLTMPKPFGRLQPWG